MATELLTVDDAIDLPIDVAGGLVVSWLPGSNPLDIVFFVLGPSSSGLLGFFHQLFFFFLVLSSLPALGISSSCFISPRQLPVTYGRDLGEFKTRLAKALLSYPLSPRATIPWLQASLTPPPSPLIWGALRVWFPVPPVWYIAREDVQGGKASGMGKA